MEKEEAVPASRMKTIPRSDIAIFCETKSLAEVAEAVARDRRMARASVSVEKGGVAGAVAAYGRSPSPNLVVVESAADGEKLMEDLQALALECVAGTKVIVVGQRNDVGLYRDLLQAGVSDYLVAPLSAMELIEAAMRCLELSEKDRLGRIIAFIGAKGGSGSSTVAHNVAAAIARDTDISVLLADLDLQFGTLDLNYDIEPIHGIKDILESTERVDDVLLERISSKRDRGLHLLPAGDSFDGSYDLSEADADRLLEVARESSWYMVLDLPHQWGPWTKKLLANADEIVITATPDLASLRNAKNMIETLVKARPNDPPPRLVINRAGTPGIGEIKPKDFAAAAKAAEWTCIPYDARLFSKASNEGRMVTESTSGSKAGRALSEIAHKVTGRRERRSNGRRRLRDMFGLLVGGRRWRDTGRKATNQVKAFRGSEDGVSAVEFALIAPVLAFAVVAMADVGLALHERMDIDHVLRTGAQAAMTDPAPAEVDGVMQAALAGLPSAEGVVLEPAMRYCVCPEAVDAPPENAASCGSLACEGSAAPYVFYRMEASKTYSPMSVPEALPDFTLSSSIQVQVR